MAKYAYHRIDTTNPNFKNAGWHVCVYCGRDFHNYDKRKKFCSPGCYQSASLDALVARNKAGRKPLKPCKTLPE